MRILCILRITSCNLSCDLSYYSSSYGLIGSVVAYTTSTNSLSSALSSCDTCLIRFVTLFRYTNLYRAIPYRFSIVVKFIATSILFNTFLNKK